MSTYKQFTSQDVIITPFSVGKKFAYSGNELTGTNVGIDFFQGINNTSIFDGGVILPLNNTGILNNQYKSTIYNSIKQLYYSNYLPNGDAQFFPSTSSYFTGSTNINHRYDNYLSSFVTESRIFPTQSNAEITVISIPSKTYGNSIVPNSFAFTYGNTTMWDDGNGNLLTDVDNTFSNYGSAKYGINVYGDVSSAGNYVGNIIYSHGIAIITSGSLTGLANTISSSFSINIQSASIAFSSSINIYENQYKCTILENEYNFSLNPSLISGSNMVYSGSALKENTGENAKPLNFTTGSNFSPYVTTVGLYNNNQELVAVGKLAQPIQSSKTTVVT